MLPDEMRAGRVFARVVLATAGLLAVLAAGGAFLKGGMTNSATWAVAAAAMAVISSMVSAWTSRRVVELQEDAMQPRLVASGDVRSRYQVAQFRLTNKGGSSAHDVQLTWTKPLLTVEGSPSVIGDDGYLPVLAAGESATDYLGLSHEVFSKYADTTAHGTVTFKTASGRKRSATFTVSLEHERRSLVHDDELPKTLYDVQKIPKSIDDIKGELQRLRLHLEKPPAD